MSWKEKLLSAFRPIPESEGLQRETELLKTIQRETGEDFAAGVGRYRKFVQEHPDSHLGRAFLIGTLRMAGKWEEALEVLREQQQLERAEPRQQARQISTRLSIGQVLYDKGEFDAAIAEFEGLLADTSKAARSLHGILYLSLGTVYLAKGQHKEARNAWKKAIQKDRSGVIAERARELLKNNPG